MNMLRTLIGTRPGVALLCAALLASATGCVPQQLDDFPPGADMPAQADMSTQTGDMADMGGGGDMGLTNPFAGDAAAATAGGMLYTMSSCNACHGDDGTNATFKDLSQHASSTDEELFTAIKDGVPGTSMVAFGDSLSDEDIWKIVTWIRGL